MTEPKRAQDSDQGIMEAHGEQKPLVLNVFRLSERAYLPTRNPDGMYYDLRSAYDVTIASKDRKEVLTDLQIFIPPGCVGRVFSRYRMASRNNIFGISGLLDSRSNGNVGIIIFNNNEYEFKIWKGDRIALMIVQESLALPIEEIKKKTIL